MTLALHGTRGHHEHEVTHKSGQQHSTCSTKRCRGSRLPRENILGKFLFFFYNFFEFKNVKIMKE